MSAVIAVPELMAQAATDLASIGSTVNAAHMVAAGPTLSMLPAAADEVSAGIAHLFSGYAQEYQALAGKAAAFQDQFVQHLTTSAVSYASAEAANVTLLLQPLTAIATPVASAATAVQNVLSDLVTNVFAGVIDILVSFSSSPLGLAIEPFVLLLFLPLVLPLALFSVAFFVVFAPAFLRGGLP